MEDKKTIKFEGITLAYIFNLKLRLTFYNYEESKGYKVELNPERNGNEFVLKKKEN